MTRSRGLCRAAASSLDRLRSHRHLPGTPGLRVRVAAADAQSRAGLLIPASLAGLGASSRQDLLVTAWYAGLTVLALALAWHGRGLRRAPGALIIAGYLAFAAALAVSVGRQAVSPVTAVVPAALIGFLAAGPCCALLTVVAAAGATATLGAALLQRQHR